MLERFTAPARSTVEGAREHAVASTAGEVRPEHLLMALLDRRECLAVRVLAEVGAPADEVRRSLDRNLGGLRAPTPKRLPFSRPAKKVLELALREAIALRHNYIGTEHLLLGLARCDDRMVADTLAELGLERGRLRAAVADAVREAG